ncbi:MAG: ABC transporter permease [Acidimicrobiales bacterium]
MTAAMLLAQTGDRGISISADSVIGLLSFTIAFATLLYLASLGELISERAGVLNLGVEGMMAMGAVTAFIVGIEWENPWLALLAGIIVGALTGGIHALMSVVLGADQVVSGLALTIFGLGLSAFVGKDYVGQPPGATLKGIDIPGLSDIPWVGEILFQQSPIVYLTVLVGIGAWFVLNRTRMGLGLRAAGESAATADATGHSVVRIRVGAVMTGGALAGASGAYLSLTLANSFFESVTAGWGWIAVALVIFGAWNPGRLALGALLFGFTIALEPRLQTFGVDLSPVLLSMLPYLLTVAAMIAISIRSRHRPSPAPAALGRPYRREER